ncbi:uncharacterized protein CXorf21-like isoform X2 [Grammomys surdaster]|uniref:uncharacterized protein CXorf21-like isoform X2 n=1 Tax=Grammomys surdaster TaxID=491861 RepID=UPI0010A0AC26|nr:uncharacterized protein CXorf21-like isoform X2 [Grammomys surdaster]
MLGEAFLTEFLYKEQRHAKLDKPLRCKKTSNDKKENWENKLLDIPDNSLPPLKTGSQEKVMEGSLTEQDNDSSQMKSMDKLPVAKCKSTTPPGNVSVALPIPKRGHDETQLDLYRSWSCTSICQNYPDLQIGVDIPLGHSPKMEPLEKTSTSKLFNGDETREKSMLLHKQPLSNSMLNNYMERKVDELYKQFLEENLTRCLSITNLMASSILMNNVNQISLQISQEQNIEASKAREALLHSLALCNLRNVSHRNSTELSTPNLQISNQASREFV